MSEKAILNEEQKLPLITEHFGYLNEQIERLSYIESTLSRIADKVCGTNPKLEAGKDDNEKTQVTSIIDKLGQAATQIKNDINNIEKLLGRISDHTGK